MSHARTPLGYTHTAAELTELTGATPVNSASRLTEAECNARGLGAWPLTEEEQELRRLLDATATDVITVARQSQQLPSIPRRTTGR